MLQAVDRSMKSKFPVPPRQSGLVKFDDPAVRRTFVTEVVLSGQEKTRNEVDDSFDPKYITVVAPSTGVRIRWPTDPVQENVLKVVDWHADICVRL
jgi:hypothetical protein